MSANLINNPDGANFQAQAVLAYVRYLIGDGIDESWDDKLKHYRAEPKVARWENCREQGYIIYLRSKDYKDQINIAFFEHRNSDNICAVKWNQCSINSLTIDNADFGGVYRDKWEVSEEFSYGQAFEMARWIVDELIEFWNKTSKKES